MHAVVLAELSKPSVLASTFMYVCLSKLCNISVEAKVRSSQKMTKGCNTGIWKDGSTMSNVHPKSAAANQETTLIFPPFYRKSYENFASSIGFPKSPKTVVEMSMKNLVAKTNKKNDFSRDLSLLSALVTYAHYQKNMSDKMKFRDVLIGVR